MDKCREEFENFCKLNLFVRLDVDGDGNFTSRETKYKFRLWCLVWKASRESMKAIKLPEELMPEYEGDGYKSRYDAAYCNGYNEALRLVEDSITSAGYKVE